MRFKNKCLKRKASHEKSQPSCSKWGVLTTIFPPSEAVRRLLYSDWCLIVIGDKKGPKEYDFPTNVGKNIFFLSAELQKEIKGSEFISNFPWGSFGRKNIGYLYAIQHGAKVIWDFDDDNMMNFWLTGASPDVLLELDTFTEARGK